MSRDAQIATRLKVTLYVYIAVLLALSGLSIFGLIMQEQTLDNLLNIETKKRDSLTKIEILLSKTKNDLYWITVQLSGGKKAEDLSQNRGFVKDSLVKTLSESEALALLTSNKDDEQIILAVRDFKLKVEEAIEVIMSDVNVGAMMLITLDDLQKKIGTLLESRSKEIHEGVILATQKTKGTATLLKWTLLFLTSISIIIVSIIVIKISKSVSVSSQRCIKFVDAIALGDFSQRIEVTHKDEFGLVIAAMNKMISNLETKSQVAAKISTGELTVTLDNLNERDLLGKSLNLMAANLCEAFREIDHAAQHAQKLSERQSGSSRDLSNIATQQASFVEEIASSITEVSHRIKVNSQSSFEVKNLTDQINSQVVDGKDKVDESILAMSQIEKASQQIGNIIKVMDSITFQTNLLALNAAIEAARAGEHGKGFAVVAEEVRTLASRSSGAASEISSIISETVTKISQGLDKTKLLGDAFVQIYESTNRAKSMIDNMTASGQEQSESVSQIATSVQQMGETAQVITSNSDEALQISQEVLEQSQRLKVILSHFSFS